MAVEIKYVVIGGEVNQEEGDEWKIPDECVVSVVELLEDGTERTIYSTKPYKEVDDALEDANRWVESEIRRLRG